MKKFIAFSQLIGKNPAFVQGRGGNTSYKESGILFIKPSGMLLKEIKETDYIICQLEPVKQFLFEYGNSKDDLEAVLNNVIANAIHKQKNSLVPSIETAMHAVIPSRYVIHTHDIYVNAFTCMKHPEKYLKRLIKKYSYLIIPYYNPGYHLARRIASLQSKQKLPPILFLKNHGLLIHANTLNEIITIHAYIHAILKKFLERYTRQKLIITSKLKMPTRHFFPDSVVYAHMERKQLPKNKQKEFDEINAASVFIENSIKALYETPIFLSGKNIEYIKNMEREKHRMRKIKEEN